MDPAIQTLTKADTARSEFAHLLWWAVEVDDIEVQRIVREELPTLVVRGIVGEDRVLAFVAFDRGTDPVTIEYIAVDEAERGQGFGSALVEDVRTAASGRAVYAQTDDDAVAFYRQVGFAITTRSPDPRWPERQRYDCVLD